MQVENVVQWSLVEDLVLQCGDEGFKFSHLQPI
jgi:hypothetical protein